MVGVTDDGQLKFFLSDPGGLWGVRVCDDDTRSYGFFPFPGDAGPAEQPSTATLESIARSVTITPQAPTIRTSPPAQNLHLVNLESWFWVDPAEWQPLRGDANAGTVTVTVTATPATLVVDPGDGSPEIRCTGGGTPYDESLPADTQRSDCTHTYTRPGTYNASATVVYDITWDSTIAPGGDLGEITPTAQPFTLQVAEGQAVVVEGGR